MKKPIKLKTTEQIQSYINFLENQKENYFTFRNTLFKREALKIAPLSTYKETSKDSIDEFKRLTCLDFKNQSLVLKIFNYQNEIISYVRESFKNEKWVIASRTEPKTQCYIRIVDEIEPIFILQGYQNQLTAILLNLNFISIPNFDYLEFNQIELNNLKNREVIFLNIESNNSFSNSKLPIQLNSLNIESKEINLNDFLKEENIEIDNNKTTLSNSLKYFKNIEQFKSLLYYYIDREEIF